MKKFYPLLFTSITCIFFITSCSLSKKIKNHDFSEEHYQQLGNDKNRIVEMRTGTFVQYLLADDKKEVWKINDGQDSTITIARQIGNPSKDGSWILTYCFMTHLHTEPLSVTLEYYEYANDIRDTIICHFHDAPTSITWDQVSNSKYQFDDLDLDQIRKKSSRNEYIKLVKDDIMKYSGATNFKKASLYADKFTLRRDAYVITPQESTFTVYFYEKDENSEPSQYPAIQVLHKLPLYNNFYPNGSIYK